MTKSQKLWLLLPLALAMGALILLAAGLARLEFRPGRPFPLGSFLEIAGLSGGQGSGGLPLPGWLWSGLVALTWLLFVLWLITFILRPQARKHMLRRLVTYLIWFLLLYALMSAIQRLNMPQQAIDPATSAGLATPVPSEQATAPPAFIANPPAWLVWAVSLALIALFLGLVWFAWQRMQRPASPLERLAQEAQQTLQALRSGDDLKDVIMRCYRDMGQVLHDQRGLRRSSTMTPREFEQYLAESGLQDEHIQRLTRLFERVRYSARAAGELEEREAVACLTAIVQAYGRPS